MSSLMLLGSGSSGSGSAAPSAPVNTLAPVLDIGNGLVGTTITVTDGEWNVVPEEIEYQLHYLGYGNPAVGGATSNSFALTESEAGLWLFYRVRARLTGGIWSEWVESNSAIPAALAPPVGIAPPVIAADGTASFYRSEPGMWEANPGVTPTFQWQFSEENATWTDIAWANDSNYSGMSPGFYYRLVEIATNSQGSASQESVSLYYQFE